MNDLFLIKPSIVYKTQYVNMMTEWRISGEKLIPWVLRLEHSDFYAFVGYLNSLGVGVNTLRSKAKYITYWLLSQEKKIIGVSNIRDVPDHESFENSGHISYGIRPSERGRGYATELLRLSLSEAARLGTKKVYITCDGNNKASEKVILKNNGVLDSEEIHNDTVVKKFYIIV